MNAPVNTIDLRYNETPGEFLNPYYQNLVNACISEFQEKEYGDKKVNLYPLKQKRIIT